MNEDIKLSVIIPVYNAELFIKRTLDCILPQLTEQIELVLVDDGSRDDTYSIIKGIIEEFRSSWNENRDKVANIVLLHQENGGCSMARNYGLKECRGEYVAFIDSDDITKPDYLCTFVDYIKGHVNVDVFISGVETYNEDGSLYEVVRNRNMLLESHEDVVRNLAYGNVKIAFPMWSKIVRRGLLIEHDITFDNDAVCMSDGLFFSKVYIHAQKVLITDYVGYEWRRRNGSISDSYYDIIPELALRFIDNCINIIHSVVKFDNDINAEEWIKKVRMERFNYVIGKVDNSNISKKRKREEVKNALDKILDEGTINSLYYGYEKKILLLAKTNNSYFYYAILQGMKSCIYNYERIVAAIKRRVIRR